MPANSNLKSKEMDMLCQALLQLETVEECYQFFEDICTMAEMHALSQRLQVAKMLKDKVTYQEISRLTGASTATISRVNRCVGLWQRWLWASAGTPGRTRRTIMV